MKFVKAIILSTCVILANYANATAPLKASPLNVLPEPGGTTFQSLAVSTMNSSQIQSGFVITFRTDATHNPLFSKTCKNNQAYNTTLDQASILLSATISEVAVDVLVKPDDDGNCKILTVGVTAH